MVRQSLTGAITDNEVLDGTEAEFVKDNLANIAAIFSGSRYAVTKRSCTNSRNTSQAAIRLMPAAWVWTSPRLVGAVAAKKAAASARFADLEAVAVSAAKNVRR